MSGGLPDAKPWASCCPRSDATMTLTLMPVLFVHAAVATLTAFVSAGPELPISAVSSVAWLFAGEPYAVAAATAHAHAQTPTDKNMGRRRFPAFQWNLKVIPSLINQDDVGAGRPPAGAAPLSVSLRLCPPSSGWPADASERCGTASTRESNAVSASTSSVRA